VEKEKKRFPPVGPYDPPLPTEADDERNEPMAVARDRTTSEDSFMPTTAPTPSRERPQEERKTVAEERHPPGFRASEEPGFLEVDEEAKE